MYRNVPIINWKGNYSLQINVFIFNFVLIFRMCWEMENNHTRLNWTLQRLMWNYGTYDKTMPIKYQIISLHGSNSIGIERKHSNSMLIVCDIPLYSFLYVICAVRCFYFGFCCSSVSNWLISCRHSLTLFLCLCLHRFYASIQKEYINISSTAIRIWKPSSKYKCCVWVIGVWCVCVQKI